MSNQEIIEDWKKFIRDICGKEQQQNQQAKQQVSNQQKKKMDEFIKQYQSVNW